jgi:hypothetical protein
MQEQDWTRSDLACVKRLVPTDLGAGVVKVEVPGEGDYTRHRMPLFS